MSRIITAGELPPFPKSTDISTSKDESSYINAVDLPPISDNQRTILSDNEVTITPNDILNISKKHNIDPKWISDNVELMGGISSDLASWDSFKQDPLGWAAKGGNFLLGLAGEAAMGIPQYIYKKTATPEGRAALDDLSDLINERKTKTQMAVEMIAGMAVPIGVGSSAVRASRGGMEAVKAGARESAKAGAISGAVSGLTHARSGEELEGAATGVIAGAILGPILTGTVMAPIAGVGAIRKKATEKLMREIESSNPDFKESLVSRGMEKYTSNQKQESLIEDTLLRGTSYDQFNPADDIVKQYITTRVPQKVQSRGEGAVNKWLSSRVGRDTPSSEIGKKFMYDDISKTASKYVDNMRGVSVEPEDALKYTSQLAKTEGSDFLSRSLREYRVNQSIRDEMHSRISDTADGDWFKSVLYKLADGKNIMNAIDARSGTELRPLMDSLDAKWNMFGYKMSEFYDSFNTKEMPLMRSLGSTRVLKVLKDLDQKSMDEVGEYVAKLQDPKERELVESLMGRFESLREDANRLGLPVQQLEREGKKLFYIPHSMLDIPETVLKLEGAFKQVSQNGTRSLDDITNAGLNNIDSLEGQLLRGLEISSGMEIHTGKQLDSALRGLTDIDATRSNMNSFASAMRERTGDIPDLIREWNPVKLLSKWTHNTFKHAYLRDDLEKLKAQSLNLRGEDLKYVNNLITDILGPRRGTFKADMNRRALQWKLNQLRKAETSTGIARTLRKGAANIPDVLPSLINNMYPYYLGFNVSGVLRNLVQPYTMTATNIGSAGHGSYGYRKLLQSQAMLTRGYRGHENAIRSTGIIAPKHYKEANLHMRRSIESSLDRKSPIVNALGSYEKAAEWISDVSMYAYTKSDVNNRMVTHTAAQLVSDDFIRGMSALKRGLALTKDQQAAIEAMKKMPSGYQSAVRSMLKRDDLSELPNIYARYLNSESQFNYSRISMSEFGRSMGVLFSMFSKWPSAIGADIVQLGSQWKNASKGSRERANASIEILQKYLGPLAAAVTATYAIPEDTRESGAYKTIIGRGDLTSWTPVSSLNFYTQGGFTTPPALSTLFKATGELARGDSDKALGSASKYVTSLVPGSTMMNLMPLGTWFDYRDTRMDDFINMIEGE